VSKSNWSYAVDKGLAGYFSCTCLPSALDCLYDDFDFPIWFYHFYTKAFLDQQSTRPNKTKTKKVFTTMIKLITKSTRLNQISFKTIRNQEESTSVLQNVRLGGFKVILVTKHLHVVGLKSIGEDRWQFVGNAVPTTEPITTAEVFPFIYQRRPFRKNKNHKDPNIYIFPPIK